MEQKIIDALKEISDLRNVEVGNKVWTAQGETEVLVVDVDHDFPIGTNQEKYTNDGKLYNGDEYHSCFTQNPFTYILEKFGNQERIVEVKINDKWYKRRLFKVLKDGACVCYGCIGKSCRDSIEETNFVGAWRSTNWREVPAIPTFTKEQICKALNVEDFEIKD